MLVLWCVDELSRDPKAISGPRPTPTSLYTTERRNAALLRKAISVTALPDSWSGYFEHQLEKLEM